jgi:hypothetical protein
MRAWNAGAGLPNVPGWGRDSLGSRIVGSFWGCHHQGESSSARIAPPDASQSPGDPITDRIQPPGVCAGEKELKESPRPLACNLPLPCGENKHPADPARRLDVRETIVSRGGSADRAAIADVGQFGARPQPPRRDQLHRCRQPSGPPSTPSPSPLAIRVCLKVDQILKTCL